MPFCCSLGISRTMGYFWRTKLHQVIKLLYDFFIGLYPTGVRLISPFNAKAKLWIEGRRDIFSSITQKVKAGDKIIWMHCASLGEFEQGRPVLEKLRKENSSHKILLTFFTPSGY